MKNQNGMILILVLIFLQIFSLLGLAAWQAAYVEMKMCRLAWFSQQVDNEAQNAMTSVTDHFDGFACEIPLTSAETLASKPLSWWRQFESCSGNFPSFQYYYVVEKLGEDPCAMIAPANQTTANYYRITLIGAEHSLRKIWQTTVVLSSEHPVDHCKGELHQVHLGRQRWREIQ